MPNTNKTGAAKTVEVVLATRNEALEMRTFLFGADYAVSVRRVGERTAPTGWEVSFAEVSR
jgi:hypothetical protein